MNWQPIETAPKDGSNFLVYLPKAKKRNYAAAYYDVSSSGIFFLHDRAGVWLHNKATHWMPLPPPPIEGE